RMGLNSKCGLHVDSNACKQWKEEVCAQCPNWKLDEDPDNRIVNGAHKFMTTDECMRLKRDLRHAFFTNNGETDFWIILMLVLFIIFCMSLALWLLAKAFVISQPPQKDCTDISSQDRQVGGRSSVDDVVQQLQDKCTVHSAPKHSDGFYVPAAFWDKFPMNEFVQKTKKTEEMVDKDQFNKSDAEATNMSSDAETNETLLTEELNEDEDVTDAASISETTNGTGDQSEQSSHEESTSGTKDIKRTTSIDSIEKMPTLYDQTTKNTKPDQRRRKFRWVNWLRRSKPVNFQA
ncbi:hypothetical protein KR215_004744, partial [Drosophila sulfurigaster]